jgi:hypothetical protein
MSNFIKFITGEKFKGVVSIVAAVIMYYTPDNIDLIIQALLAAYGCSVLVLKEKDAP